MGIVRADVVASLLRLLELLEAQAKLAGGGDGRSRVQGRRGPGGGRSRRAPGKGAGLEVVIDREMRCLSFQGQMTAAIEELTRPIEEASGYLADEIYKLGLIADTARAVWG